MRLGYHTITWGGVVGDAVGVTSVKDLYYRVNGPMDRAIAEIGALGYEGVEMFDGNVADYASRPDDLKNLLAAAGVELVSVYTGGNFIYEEILSEELDASPARRTTTTTCWVRHSTPSSTSRPSTGSRPATTRTSPRSWRAPQSSNWRLLAPVSASVPTLRTWQRAAVIPPS